MRWTHFAILSAVFIVLQTALTPWLELPYVRARPDWVFILVIYLGLTAPRTDGIVGAWILGLLVDLNGGERLGLFAMVYALNAMLIVRLRGLLFRDHPITNLGVTFLFGLGGQSVVAIYRLVAHPGTTLFSAVSFAVMTALYTAVFAPYFLKGLRRTNALLGAEHARRARYATV